MTVFLNAVAALWVGIASLAFLAGVNQDRAVDGLQLAVLIAIYARLCK